MIEFNDLLLESNTLIDEMFLQVRKAIFRSLRLIHRSALGGFDLIGEDFSPRSFIFAGKSV